MIEKKSMYLISKEIETCHHIIEQCADPETGEIKELPEEVESQLETLLQQLTDKTDDIGLSIALKEKEIEGLKEFEASIRKKRKSIENGIERFKVAIAPIVRRYGEPTGKNDTPTLVGRVVKVKDNSKYEFEHNFKESSFKCINTSENEYSEIPDKFKTVIIEFPLQSINKMSENTINIKSQDAINIKYGINLPTLKKEYENKLSTSAELADKNSAVVKLSDIVKSLSLYGLKKVWKNKTTFLNLKKLEVHSE